MESTVISCERMAPQSSTSYEELSVPGPSNIQPDKYPEKELEKVSPPTYILKSKLLEALSTVGATSKPYTSREILGLLKTYILKNRSLIDSQDSQFVNCGGTALGNAFNVDRFQYSEVRYLLSQSVTATSQTTHQIANLRPKPKPYIKNAIFIPLPTIPEYQSGPETDYSCQGCETEYCHDSDDELSSPPSSASLESGEEEVEYEPVTEDERNDSVDSDSEAENYILILKMDNDAESTEDGFADDESDTSCTDDSNSYNPSEDEADQWPCLTCGIKNKPFFHYCLKCWQIRKDWFPDPPKKRKKRKPRPKKAKRKSSLRDQQMTLQGVSKEALSDLPSDALERQGSNASSSTQSSSTSWVAISTSSQESGFGSQEVGSDFVREPARKRKASERSFEDGNNDLCVICFSRPRNASFIHGRMSHIACCYPCAKRVYKSKLRRCPICRRKIHMVTKNSYV